MKGRNLYAKELFLQVLPILADLRLEQLQDHIYCHFPISNFDICTFILKMSSQPAIGNTSRKNPLAYNSRGVPTRASVSLEL
jgi:hypothetical protein